MKNSKQLIVVFLLSSFLLLPLVLADLRDNFYRSSCPNAESIVRSVVAKRFASDKSIIAALLRMHFHDCFVRGCDASILINKSASQNKSEKEAGPNQTVRGYELIDEIKRQLEAACSQKVSCADIITLATRDAVALAGGPSYTVPTGRRDGLVSNPSEVNLPGPSITVPQSIQFFNAKNITTSEMVTLLGAHTVGVAHCNNFQDRLSSFQGTRLPDLSMNRALIPKLKNICHFNNANASLDQGTPFKIDNEFYKQIQLRNGLIQIDQQLIFDRSTRGIVSGFASNENRFRQSFADAMVKMSKIEVLVDNAGEIRRSCGAFNGKSNPSPVVSKQSSPKTGTSIKININ